MCVFSPGKSSSNLKSSALVYANHIYQDGKMNVAMGTFCLATLTAWQIAKLLLWHSCQATYTGIGVWVAVHNASHPKFPITCLMKEWIWLEMKYLGFKGGGFVVVEGCLTENELGPFFSPKASSFEIWLHLKVSWFYFAFWFKITFYTSQNILMLGFQLLVKCTTG